MIIECDMDSVLVDMVPTWLVKYNALTGENICQDDVRDWKIDYCVRKPRLLTKILEEPGFFLDLPPMKDAKIYFKMLLKQHDVIIVTQPPRGSKTGMEDKRRWMRRYFPEFDTKNMIFAHRKEIACGGDLLFDDNSGHLTKWAKANTKGTTVVMDYVYNRDINPTKRVYSWKEFYEYVQSIAR